MSTTVEHAWRLHRAYLVNLSYQILGDVGEAEDVVQESFLRLARTDPDEVVDVRGWLTVVASRLCLDQVRSARARREAPDDMSRRDVIAPGGADPAERVTLDDEVRGALTTVLDRLSPPERVAFVLHDVFGVPFEEIGHIVGRPVGTCRQLARRARMKVRSEAPPVSASDTAPHHTVTAAFIDACAGGDLAALTALLDPEVWGVGTVLADPAPAPQVNHGPDAVARNLMLYLGPGTTLVAPPAVTPMLLAFSGPQLFAVIVLTIRDGRVHKIEATADPSARLRPGADPTV